MGPTHIAMDSRKTPSFTRTTSSSSNYVLGVYDKYQGTWAGIASDDSCTTVCEKGLNPTQPYDYQYEGCYTEVATDENRDLSERTLVDSAMTVDICATHCRDHGFKYCGLEAGVTCRCGNTRGRYGRLATTSCDAACPGDPAQICGGTNIIAVYRVTSNACVDSMPAHPTDPTICFSFVNNSLLYSGGISDCLLQGTYPNSKGKLLSMENPYVEEAAYHQLFRSILRPTAGNQTESVALSWIGLNQLGNRVDLQWESGLDVTWGLFDGADGQNFWQFAFITNISLGGLWKETFTFMEQHPYACQITDGSQKIFGEGIQHQHTSTGTVQTVREGEVETARMFDYGCLLDRTRCPNGFTIHMWVKVIDVASNHHILSTGDCMTDIIASKGFCLSYLAVNQSIVALDVRNNTCKRLEVRLPTGTIQTHLSLYFTNETDMYLYMNGDYKGQLNNHPDIDILGHVEAREVYINYNDGANIELENVTFIASPPDQRMLELYRDTNSPSVTQNLTDVRKDFGLWGLDLTPWGSPGVDGDGLSLSRKAFTYELGQTTKEWLADPTVTFTLATWIKVPLELKEDIDIITFGGGYVTLFSLSYNATLNQVKFLVASADTSYSGVYSLALGEWQHISLTYDLGYFSVYLNGDFVGSLGKWTAATDPGGNYTVKVYAGSAMCPLGWRKNELSCYMIGQAPSNEYWPQDYYCQEFGGHLVAMDSGQELEFLAKYLEGSGSVYTGIFNQVQFPSPHRAWFDTRGNRRNDTYFSDPKPNTVYENFVSMYFDPFYNMSIPVQSGNTAQNLSALGNGTNVTEVDTSFSGVTACEINLSGKHSRQQMSMRCLDGWYFLYDRCYKLTTVAASALQAVRECNKDRAVLPQITTSAKQIYLSNWIRSIMTEATLYLGLQLRQPMAGNASYLWNDMRPLPFTYWGTKPVTGLGADCVVMNCTKSTTSCLWESVSCDSPYPTLCERPADTECGPGWKLYKDKCVSMVNVTNAEDGWATCTVAGTLPISLITKADMDEYIYTFELGSSTCLTTGILDIGGNYVINSPDMLTASHTCIGLDATGPIQQPCANFDCVICEHYVDGGVSIDNVHIKSELLDATAVKDLYLQEAYMRITYIWDMESSNATATVVEGSRIMDNQTLQYCMVELHTEASVAVTTDPTMGNVLQITDSLTGAFYNLSQSDACLQSISECKQGITVMFWIAGTNISNCVLVDTTANETGSTGVKIWVDESGRRLYASVLELNYVWEGWIWVVTQDWVHIAITWQSHIGLRFHINFRCVYTVTRREIQTVFAPTVVPSSSLYVGLCTDHVLLHLDDLEVYNYALESRELLQLQKTKDIEKMIDFNEAVSSSNMNLEKNISLTETVWRNSLFQTVVRVDNHLGQSPAMYSNQLPHCFTRADLCSGPFTTSLWLRPLYMEADQVFLTAGTSMDTDMTSLKIWYDSYTDDYILEVFYDKIHFTINFYMTLYKWSHLIINGNLGNSELYLYVNGQAAVTTTTTFVVDRMPPEYDVTFLRVGEVGTFEIDDIRHFPSIKQAKDIYELKSCHEYELAGFNGVQQLAMNFDPWDGAMGSPNATCDLQSYQTFQFRMDQNETSNSLYNITLEDTTTNSMVFTDGVLNEAILLNTSGLLVNITSEKCFGSIAHCYFGFTMAMWVRPQSDPLVPSTDPFVVMRMGGNLTRNESGISIECTDPTGLLYHSNSTLCSLVLVNHTRKWSTSFYLMYNSWSHLAITWNPYYTLNLYKNAHSVSDLGAVITSEIVSGYSFINQSESTLCIGCFLGSSDVVMAVDEVYLLDMDMSQKDIRKLYGVHHLCSKDWKYLSHTDMCYHFSTATATHPQGELTCQSFGGNLADEVDLQTHQLFVQIAVEDGLTGKYFLNYKQLPRKGAHALRVPDGSVRTFTTFNLPTTSTRKCGLLYKSTTWKWDDCDCSSIKTFMCQNNPWYAMAEPLYLNHSSISQTPDLVHQWTGNVGYKRGVTSYTMALNDTQLHQVASDRCLVDHRFCHNGLTISFWLQVCNNSAGDNQMILTTMDSPTVYGLAVYWNRSAGLVVDMRTQDNFTRTVTPISECHWNNIAISINNETNVQMFINGKEVAADLTYNETDTAALVLGHEVQVSIGTQADGSQGLVAMLDNITVVEHKVLDDVHLHQTVYDNFPDFHLTFDNHSLILPSSGVSSTSGWHGDCLTFDGTNSTQFEGHLYQDCLVAPDFCWEGFTLSLWLYPTTDAGSQGIMSARSDYRGLAMAYYVSYQGLPNHHWLIIQENNVAHNVPFILSNHVWSHIILTWYSNGSTVLYVNGIEQGQTASTTAVTTGNPPQPTTFTLGAISGYNDISSGIFQGAIDEYWFRPRPLESNTMLDLYKNSTYVRTKFVNRFEDSPPPEYGKATLVQAVYGTGSSLVSGQDWLNLTQRLVNQPNCVLDIDHCIHGFTLSLYLQMIQENDTDQVILTTGAHNSQGLGIALLYTAMNKSLPFRRYLEVTILTTNSEYRTWFNMQWWTWNLVTITFHPMFGVKVYVDDILTSMSDAGAPRAIAPTIFTQDLLIGDVPFGNLWLGQFAVDDLQILDRAMFEGDLWMQHVHSHLQVDGVMVWDDVTRDECHHLCDNTTCSVFAFCDDGAFGSCVVYSDNVTSNFSSDAVHSHASCDLFTKMNTLHQVQLYGCFPASVINDMLLLPGPADISSCIDACIDNITKTRYAAFNSQCYCGLETIPIAITAADYNTNQSCTIHEVLVYQLSGLREFLNVTVPITSLDVMLDPGAVVMVDQDLYVTFVAMTELAYAGFSISAGDGRDTYYTGRNYTTLVYPTMGLYILHIEALNEFSWMTDSIPIYVMTSLEGVEIYSENITATDTALAVTLNVIGGNYVTCTLIYGDGFQDSVYHENTSVPFLFSHVYTQENINMINVTCANNVSQTQTWKTVVSLHAVENLTLTAPQCCPLGDNINITWFADRGSNVSLNLYHSDQLVFEGEQLTLADPTSLLVNSSIYHVTGIHTFNLTVTNIVSALVQQATNVNIATEIGSLNINISNQFVRVDESFSCALSISNMSIADVIIDFDDGTTDSHFSLNHTMLYEYLVKHKFSSAGSFLINANATNCYNSVNDSTTLVVEHPVDVLTAAVITVADPFDLLKVNLTLVNASTPHPTSAVCDINFGDGGTETLNPLVFVNGYIELSHNYSANGIFTISVFCHNNISSFTHIESVKVGSDIVGLSINTLSHIPQGSVSSISINIDSGSLVLYSIDFGDGSPHYSTTTPVTYTNGQINVTHHFSQIAVYTLTVTANNTFGTVINNTVTVSIMEEVTGLIFYGSRISKVGWPVDFYIRFLSPGTDTCIHFSPGDGTEYVYGGANCPLKTEYSGYIYIDSTDNPLEITHAYILPNTYHITVQAENEVSVENDQMSVVILEFPCTFPKVTIMGFSSNISRPSYSYPSVALTVRALADTYCMPIHKVIFEWNIMSHSGSFNRASINMESLPYLYIPALSLGYGLYVINVTVYIEGFPFFNDTSIVYLYEDPTPMVLELVGGEERTVPVGSTVLLDASHSVELDFPIHQTLFEIHWFSWTSPDEFDPVIHEASAYLTTLDVTFPSLPAGAGDNTTTVTLPGADLGQVMTRTIVAKMSLGTRVKWKVQDILVTDTSVSMLSIKCVENCYSIISADLPVRVKGECLTCTEYNRLQLTYLWKLYKVAGIQKTLIQNLDTWTYTGINSANLAIKPGLLEPGEMYEVRLESGDDYCSRTFRVTWSPYNGQCLTNINLGLAFKSKFIVSCTDWLDEGDNAVRDYTIDRQYTRNYEFTFYLMVNTSTEYKRTPFFRVLGSWATAPEMMLGEGDPNLDNQVELVVTIKDFYGSVTTITNSVKVMPPVYTSLETTNCTEMELYEAEKDMMGILMLANGITNRLKQDISRNGENQGYDVQVMTATIDKLADNVHLIQDEVLAANTIDTLNNMITMDSTMDNLQPDNKMKIGELYQNMAGSLQQRFKSSMSSDEKQKLATDLLSGVVTYAQNTKYSTDCLSGCDAKLKQGEFVVEFIQITHNISSMLLEDTVPGEEERIVNIPQYKTTLCVKRQEALEVLSSTLTLQGEPVFDVPDLSGIINILENNYIDVEMMVADNLYTTDASSEKIKAQTAGLTLHVDGQILHVTDLVSAIRVRSQPHVLQELTFTSANLSASSDTNLFYIQLTVNETDVTPLFVLRSRDENVTLRYYVKVGTPPLQTEFDLNGVITSQDLQDVSGNGTLWQTIIQLSHPTIASSLVSDPPNMLYLGLRTENQDKNTAIQIALYVLDCLFWDDGGKQWSRKGLTLGNVTTYTETSCHTSHLTSFGTNVFVPPNTIDFKTVWSKFSADNVAVIATVGGLIVLYFLVLFWVRRADQRDVAQWAIYPLCDNLSTDRYHYQMTVYTGLRQNSGTTSKVFFVLGGEDGDTEVRAVEDSKSRPLTRGSVNNYLLSVPFNLGNLNFLRIWHDNTGKGTDADWYLNMVLIKDLQNNQKYMFLCNQWMAVDKGDQEVERLLPVATQDELKNFDHLFYTRTRQDLTDGHLWISVLSRPTQSVFTRVQRLSCCLSLLFLTMVTNAMWYGTMDNQQQQNVHLGPFTFSGQELITSIAGSLIVVPVSIIIITFFKKAERRASKDLVKVEAEPEEEKPSRLDKMLPKKGLEQYCSDECCDERAGCVSPSAIDTALVQPFSMYRSWADFENRTSRLINSRKNQQMLKESDAGKKKKQKPWPFWCLYVAWALVILSVLASGFFVILYSIEWGTDKSSRWLTAFFLSFIESVILIQPLKVVTVALVLILVFRRVDDDDEEAYVNKIVLPEVMATERQSIPYPTHRKPYKEKASDFTNLENAREYRKRMNRLFNIGRELGAYIVYLVIVCILTYENRSKNAYPTYSHLENTFLKPASKYHASYINISSAEYFWNWAHDVLIPGLYSEGMYSGNDSTDYHGYLSDNIHYRVGTPRLRQARVTKADCRIPSGFRKFFKDCYPDYGLDSYDSESYGVGWTTQSANNSGESWQYQDSLKLNGYPVVAKYDSYGGGGYVASLGNTNQTATDMFNYLHDSGWIDRNTRAVLVEANIYNPNVNLFSVICFVLEFPASGSIIPFSQISPVALYRYNGASALFLLILDFVFVAFTLYYLFILVKKIKQEKCEFFKQFWNVIDFLNMAFSITACVFYGMHFIMVELATSDFHRNKDAFLNLQYIVLWDALFGYMLAFLLFCSMLKLLLILRFNPKITQLSGTLQKAKGPISNFMVVFVLTFLAFAQFGYLVFGRVDQGYYTFITTLETLMSMLMMKMEIDNMMLTNGLLGSLFVFLFVLFIVFILINMLLSVINDAFTEVRKDPSFLPDDPAMASFLLNQIKAFILGYSNDSTKKGTEKTKEKNLEGKIDDLDLRLRAYLQALHRDPD
ncbi:uncharacterized protein [Argopecten irradians]|uniref:uncharacterized protein n=1 Tax=Argopecten irradians TaxID=31199 RepID=UPI003720CBB1